MRPCNQCRRPVENSVTICDRCKQWNADQRNESPGSDSKLDVSQENESDTPVDHSYAILMGVFCLVITGLFALIGLEVAGFQGFLIGGTIGFVAGLTLFSISIKM